MAILACWRIRGQKRPGIFRKWSCIVPFGNFDANGANNGKDFADPFGIRMGRSRWSLPPETTASLLPTMRLNSGFAHIGASYKVTKGVLLHKFSLFRQNGAFVGMEDC